MRKKYFSLLKDLDSKSESMGREKDDKVLILDGLNNFLRVFAANPALNDDGDHIGGLVGFLNSLGLLIRTHNPTRLVICFDGKGGSQRRSKVYSDYKENRRTRVKLNRNLDQTADEEYDSMKVQMTKLGEYLGYLPVTVLSMDNVEADDVIAYCAQNILKKEVVIVSTDRDFYQIVNDRITVWNPIKKQLIDKDYIHDKFNISIDNFIWYRVLDGDKSDNIPGIPGVGLKTLQKAFPILQQEGQVSVDDIMEYIDQKEKLLKVDEKIRESKDIIERNFDLMQLKEVIMPESMKSNVRSIINNSNPKLDIYSFKKSFMRDKLYTNIKNLDYWLRVNFFPLNVF